MDELETTGLTGRPLAAPGGDQRNESTETVDRHVCCGERRLACATTDVGVVLRLRTTSSAHFLLKPPTGTLLSTRLRYPLSFITRAISRILTPANVNTHKHLDVRLQFPVPKWPPTRVRLLYEFNQLARAVITAIASSGNFFEPRQSKSSHNLEVRRRRRSVTREHAGGVTADRRAQRTLRGARSTDISL